MSIENSFFTIALAFAILCLVYVIWKQNKKIKELSTPKYGFLGKPLKNFIIGLFVFGTTFIVINTINQPTNQEIDISNANFEVEVQIVSTKISDNKYKFNFLPFINNQLWGDDVVDYKFTVFWTIEKDSLEIEKFIEQDITKSNPGGILYEVQDKNVIVKASVFVGSREFTNFIEVEI